MVVMCLPRYQSPSLSKKYMNILNKFVVFPLFRNANRFASFNLGYWPYKFEPSEGMWL